IVTSRAFCVAARLASTPRLAAIISELIRPNVYRGWTISSSPRVKGPRSEFSVRPFTALPLAPLTTPLMLVKVACGRRPAFAWASWLSAMRISVWASLTSGLAVRARSRHCSSVKRWPGEAAVAPIDPMRRRPMSKPGKNRYRCVSRCHTCVFTALLPYRLQPSSVYEHHLTQRRDPVLACTPAAGYPGQQNGRQAASGANRFRLRVNCALVAPGSQAPLENPGAWQQTSPDALNQPRELLERRSPGQYAAAEPLTVHHRDESPRARHGPPPGYAVVTPPRSDGGAPGPAER